MLAINAVIRLAVSLDIGWFGTPSVNNPGDQICPTDLTRLGRSRSFSDLNIKINLFHFISFLFW
jgi:hypothetical protein